MSLKDDIELIRSMIKYQPPTHPTISIHQALSRIEAALVVDDGPPREGDACAWLAESGNFYVVGKFIDNESELIMYQDGYMPAVLLMRADEVARRIKEAGK